MDTQLLCQHVKILTNLLSAISAYYDGLREALLFRAGSFTYKFRELRGNKILCGFMYLCKYKKFLL